MFGGSVGIASHPAETSYQLLTPGQWTRPFYTRAGPPKTRKQDLPRLGYNLNNTKTAPVAQPSQHWGRRCCCLTAKCDLSVPPKPVEGRRAPAILTLAIGCVCWPVLAPIESVSAVPCLHSSVGRSFSGLRPGWQETRKVKKCPCVGREKICQSVTVTVAGPYSWPLFMSPAWVDAW